METPGSDNLEFMTELEHDRSPRSSSSKTGDARAWRGSCTRECRQGMENLEAPKIKYRKSGGVESQELRWRTGRTISGRQEEKERRRRIQRLEGIEGIGDKASSCHDEQTRPKQTASNHQRQQVARKPNRQKFHGIKQHRQVAKSLSLSQQFGSTFPLKQFRGTSLSTRWFCHWFLTAT